MGEKLASGGFAIPDSSVRRQNMTTWGMLALAVFIAVGMGEWSKRQAAGETVIEPAVMAEAVKIAARARDSGVKGFKGEGISNFEIRNSDFENTLSDLSVSAVNYSATAEAQRRGGVFDFSGNEAATIQTSAGGEK
jgi:hypothetical protein